MSTESDDLTWQWLQSRIKELSQSLGFKVDDSTVDTVVLREIALRFNKETARRPGMDAFKRAGFLAFWIRKLKPIQPRATRLLLVNELFAYVAGLAVVDSVHPGAIRACHRIPSAQREETVDKFERELTYTLRYRPVSPHVLGMIFYAIWNLESDHPTQ